MKKAVLMRGFGECNHGEFAYDQPGHCIHAEYADGRLRVTVDCYSWLRDDPTSDGGFDVDAWERLKLVMEPTPGTNLRVAWYEAFRVARALRSGGSIQLGDAQPFSMADWVAEANSLEAPSRFGVEYGGRDA